MNQTFVRRRPLAEFVVTGAGLRVRVRGKQDWIDWPILRLDGTVAFDNPERIYRSCIKRVKQMLIDLKKWELWHSGEPRRVAGAALFTGVDRHDS
jgi:hypothetical protein